MAAITIAGTWRIATSAEPVWQVISDLETWPQWWPAIREVSADPTADGGDGASAVAADDATLTFDTPAPLRPLVVHLRVLERAAPERLVATTTGGPLDGDATMELVEHEDHTAVAFDISLRVRSLLFRPLEPILAGATRSSGRERLRKAGDDLARLAGADPLDHDV